MGASASQCARACCGCCWSEVKAGKGRSSDAATMRDEAETWFEHDNVPLLSAAHEQGTLDKEITVRKVLVMRSPKHAEPPINMTRGEVEVEDAVHRTHSRTQADSSSPKRGHRTTNDRYLPSPRDAKLTAQHDDNSASSSNDDGSWELASPGRMDNEQMSPVRSPRVQTGGTDEDYQATSPRRRTAGSPHRTADQTHQRNDRPVSAASQERGGEFDDDDGDVTEELPSLRSPRSPGKQSSSSSSPKRKPRYGRKNYRADSNRKKTL